MASGYVKSKTRLHLTSGQSVRIAREMLKWSQNELAKHSGLAQTTISGIEADRIQMGVDRAKKLARALKLHPAVLLFPDWDVEKESVA